MRSYTHRLRLNLAVLFPGGAIALLGSGLAIAEPAPLKLQAEPLAAALLDVTGTLDASDLVLPDGSFYDEHPFAGEAGQELTITLESDVFDTYLWLLDADDNVVADNDDADDSTLNSAFTVTLPADGTYRAIANSLEGNQLGTYRLTITPTVSPEGAEP